MWEGTQDLGEHREGLGEHREGLEEHREGMGEHREVVVGSTCLLGPEREENQGHSLSSVFLPWARSSL